MRHDVTDRKLIGKNRISQEILPRNVIGKKYWSYEKNVTYLIWLVDRRTVAVFHIIDVTYDDFVRCLTGTIGLR